MLSLCFGEHIIELKDHTDFKLPVIDLLELTLAIYHNNSPKRNPPKGLLG